MTDHAPDAHRPMPAEVPLALKSNLVLGPNAQDVARDPTHAWTLAQRCELAEKCLPEAGYRARLERLHSDMLTEIEQLRRLLRRAFEIRNAPRWPLPGCADTVTASDKWWKDATAALAA